MHTRLQSMVVAVGIVAVMGACTEWPTPVLPAAHLLRLAQDVNGELDCVAPGDATCSNLPYDGDCLVVEVEVDPSTGRTCQRCQLADGTMIDQGCAGGLVSCVLVTLPEPDCVVCAYVDGAVIFSTCQAGAAPQCVDYTRYDDQPCQRCFDQLGRVVYDSCPADCTAVICPPLNCAAGLTPQRRPSECCARCQPVTNCDGVVCAMDFAIPACPAGTALTRDPVDCCGYLCQPNQCSAWESANSPQFLPPGCATHLECPEGMLCSDGLCGLGNTSVCPIGYVWRDEFPFCGQCVAQDGGRSCLSDMDCGNEEFCAYDNATCGAGEPDPSGGSSGVAVCYGTCRPLNPDCAEANGLAAPMVPCEGSWSITYDLAGCPYPLCICPDGSTSLDGICRDLCADADCLAAPLLTCGQGFHVDLLFPYCCGVCVPDDVCAFIESGARPGGDAPILVCPEVNCILGFHPEMDPVTCCPWCVADVTDGCLSSNECTLGFYCSTEEGVCAPPPGCDPNSGSICASVCYGQCLPIGDQTRAECTDSDGGLEPYLRGVVTASVAGVIEEVADLCTPDGGAVIEQYCYTRSDGRYRQSVTVQCAAAGTGTGLCIDGACR